MSRAAIYVRFSSHNQREASIEDQVRTCRQEAGRRGDLIVDVYADRARSGTTTAGRDEFARMMEDAKGAKFEVLYVYKLDRFARNRYDSAINRKRLRENDVELRPMAESVPDGPEGIVLEAMLEGMAEYYSANLSQNVRRGMDGNALECMHNGARLYGCDLGDDGFYHVREDEAKVVRLMFDMYDERRTCPEIVEALAPYRTRTGKGFHTSHVMQMLRNEKYAGTYVYKDHRVPGGMEAIVSVEQFERVGERIGRRKERRPFRSKVSYALSGRLHDEEGRPYVGVSGTARDGSKRCYYKCLETGVSWRRDEVEEAMGRPCP
jgi:DNA invertase Pin-like site-specific DNA recombinase